jgi:excisionase family DNA binding protein
MPSDVDRQPAAPARGRRSRPGAMRRLFPSLPRMRPRGVYTLRPAGRDRRPADVRAARLARPRPEKETVNKRTYTIAEAAELTGLSRKAIARRVERGSLQSLVRGGRRLIPRAELARAGLIPEEGEIDDRDAATGSALFPQRPPSDEHAAPGDASALAALMRELVDRLERQASEIAHYRALTAEAESLRLAHELGDLRARLTTLEDRRAVPELGQGASGPSVDSQPVRAAAASAAASRASADERIWLPPSATAAPGPVETARPATQVPQQRERWSDSHPVAPRLLGLVAEALFIVAVAFGAWRADLRPAFVVAAVAGAWVLVAALEWLRWSDRARRR